MSIQFDMFSLSDRYEALSKQGDPLEKLNQIIDWSMFRPLLNQALEKDRKSPSGRLRVQICSRQICAGASVFCLITT